MAPMLCAPLAARADEPVRDSATAQALFDQAKKLMADGNFPDACPKLAESQRLDPGVGTLLNLAHCYEEVGRTATAWSTFLEAAAAARTAGQADRESAAREKAAALAPVILSITINVAGADKTPGLQVTRDGALVGDAQWGSPIPLDQGLHVIVAKAPGRATWETKVLLKGGGTIIAVNVPELGLPGAAAPATNTPSTPAAIPVADSATADGTHGAGLRGQRLLGVIAGGVGVVGVAVGTVFGLSSKSKHDDALAHCDGPACRDQDGLDLKSQARSAGTISTVAFVVGAAGLGAGAVLWFTAKPAAASPQVGLGLGGIVARASW